jgi:hypothetical protein
MTSTEELGRQGGGRRSREGPTKCVGKPVTFDSQDTHGSGRGFS